MKTKTLPGKRITAVMMTALLVLSMLIVIPAVTQTKAEAAATSATFFMFKGNVATISMTSNAVPNARWKSSNTKVITVKKKSSASAEVTGKGYGTATLTVYNSKKTSQKYSYTVKVTKNKGLTKADFYVSGWQMKQYLGVNSLNLVNKFSGKSCVLICCDIRTNYKNKYTNAYVKTYRDIRLGSTYAQVKQRYGAKALVKETLSKDRIYKNCIRGQTGSTLTKTKNFFKTIKYYNDYFYGKWGIRFYYNTNKKVIGIHYFYNYSKI